MTQRRTDALAHWRNNSLSTSKDSLQRNAHGLAANRFAITAKTFQLHGNMYPAPTPLRPPQPDRSYRFAGSRASRAGDSGYCHREIRLRACQRSFCHGASRAFAHRARALEHGTRYSETADLGFIAIGHESLDEPLRAPANISDRLGNPAAGAGLSRRHHAPALQQVSSHASGEAQQSLVGSTSHPESIDQLRGIWLPRRRRRCIRSPGEPLRAGRWTDRSVRSRRQDFRERAPRFSWGRRYFAMHPIRDR